MVTQTSGVEWLVHGPAQPAEGPVWDARRRVVWWVDIMPGRLHWWSPDREQDGEVALGQPVGTVGLASGGQLVVALADGIELLIPPDPPTADGRWERQRICDLEADRPATRANDGKPGPDGALWVGTMAIDCSDGQGGFYRVTDVGAHVLIDDVGIANGLDWPDPADPSVLYWTDSLAGSVDLLHVRDGAVVTSREPVVRVDAADGVPDGMVLDADGNLWVAVHGAGEIRVHAPDGRLLDRLSVGARLVTCCAFGGDDLRDLYVTVMSDGDDAGGLAVIRDAGTGRRPYTYRQPADPPN